MRIKSILAIWAIIAVSFCAAFEVLPQILKSRLVLKDGGTPAMRKSIENALTAVLQEANKIAEGKGNIESVKPYCTPEGFAALKALVDSTRFSSNIPEHQTNLLETPQGQYEVRGLRVGVRMGETTGDPTQFLVFTLNADRKIINVQFAIEAHHYERLFDPKLKLGDVFQRKVILGFLEEYRTAHNRKDINYLEKVYSDFALIIVGPPRDLQPKGEGLEGSFEQSKSKLIRKSKQEYIEALRRVFKLNNFVKVFFDDVAVTRHPKYADIYGIKVKQRWTSSRFNDEGYLFVMIDFQDRKKPIIHVRAWQPEPFSDGSVVNLGYFKILK